MMEDRRYRQQGYKEYGAQRRGKPEEPYVSRPAGPGRRSVSRCADCGTLLPASTDPFGRCPHCKVELHACKQCAHFDPGRRFECRQPVPERIPDKRARNECAFFSLPVVVEAAASSGSTRAEDARRAFKNLFKRT